MSLASKETATFHALWEIVFHSQEMPATVAHIFAV